MLPKWLVANPPLCDFDVWPVRNMLFNAYIFTVATWYMMKHCNYVKRCACNCRAACASSKPWLILTQSVSHSFAESKESNSDEESNTSFFHLLISCTSQKRQYQSWSVMSQISSNKFEYFLHLIVLVILTQSANGCGRKFARTTR